MVRRWPAATITTYSTRKMGYHREDGPSFVAEYNDGTYEEEWHIHDKLHRYGGPARHYHGLASYFIHGKEVTETVNKWLDEREYVWGSMSEQEKWELELFMRSLG